MPRRGRGVSPAPRSSRREGERPAAVGVIGGSGLYDMEGLEDVRWVEVKTPFGRPSDRYCVGRLGEQRVIFLPRHGRGHRRTPSELNYRANIYGLKTLGASWVVSVSAVGSLREEIRPLDFVVPDQFYDHTRQRVSSFFGDGIVGHVGMAHPVCPELAGLLERVARESGATVHRGGTYICIEGPQFSTRGESEVYRGWGMSIIGMTNMPEAKLAREAELHYATLALVTDYDVWHPGHDAVTVEAVVANLLKNVARAREVLRRAIPEIGKPCSAGCDRALQHAVITDPGLFPPRIRARLTPLIGRYFPRHLPRRASRD
jgi:5'-methylthioadenosine phosphorylase